MDPKVLENKTSHSLRRSARHAPVKALNFEPTPRGPLKRTKKGSENKPPVSAVNGTSDVENGSDGEESPKKRRRDSAGSAGSRGDESKMDVQESAEEDMEQNDSDQEKDIQEDSSPLPKIYQGALGDVNLFPCVVLGERCLTSRAVNEDLERTNIVRVKPAAKASAKPHTKTFEEIRSTVNRYEIPTTKIKSMAEYRTTLEAIAKGADVTRVNHVSSAYPASEKPYAVRQRVNNIPTQKDEKDVQHKKQERLKKTAFTKKKSGNSSTGCTRYLWGLVLLVLLGSATLLAYKFTPVLQRMTGDGLQPPRDVNAEKFADRMSLLETQFPSQRPDLYKRSKVHLENHLKTAQPTQPVSLILAAGRKAEKTLHCLAQTLASSFSSALTVSVLHIDGSSKTSQDSDEVKLDIDRQLQAAFEGEKPVAVIHRFEELPPSSTLIFYRYCDHENAAYKRPFLLFTVLLPQDEIRDELSLKEVEEMVHDYLKERLVGSSSPTAFNNMDTDKYSGLWSRISHLVLPVLPEEEVEQKGC